MQPAARKRLYDSDPERIPPITAALHSAALREPCQVLRGRRTDKKRALLPEQELLEKKTVAVWCEPTLTPCMYSQTG